MTAQLNSNIDSTWTRTARRDRQPLWQSVCAWGLAAISTVAAPTAEAARPRTWNTAFIQAVEANEPNTLEGEGDSTLELVPVPGDDAQPIDSFDQEQNQENMELEELNAHPGAAPPLVPRQTPLLEEENAIRPLSQIRIQLAPSAGLQPEDYAAKVFARAGVVHERQEGDRPYMQYTYYWQSTGFCHQPLYFEEPNLERYGYSAGLLQPAVSAAHFFGTVPLLPYKMVVEPPRSCEYTLGYYRPGNRAPLRRQRLPLSFDAAMVEGVVITGLIFLIP